MKAALIENERMEKLKSVVELTAFYVGAALLLLLSGVIALYLVHALIK